MTPFRITYFVHENWRRDPAGTSTFVRMVEPEWSDKRGIQFIELPFDPGSTTGGVVGDMNGLTQDRRQDSSEPLSAGGRHAVAAGIHECVPAFPGLRLLLGYLFRLMADIRFLIGIRRRVRGRLLLTNQFGCETLPIALRCVFPRRRILAIAHTHPGQDASAHHRVRRLMERLCYRAVSDVVYNSRAVKELWSRKLHRSDLKGRVIHHGLPDAVGIIPADYPVRVEGSVDFVYIARFYSWKGQEGFLHAWKQACMQGMPNSRIIFIGDGERLEAARTLAMALGTTSSVIFMGSRPEAASYFTGADVAVLLSSEPEAFGLVLLEAMRSGLPILASRMGGIPEVVRDGVNGVLVDPAEPAAVAKAIIHLANQPGERKRLGVNGRDLWKQEFSMERMLAEYDRLLNGQPHVAV